MDDWYKTGLTGFVGEAWAMSYLQLPTERRKVRVLCVTRTGLTGFEPATSAVTGRCSNRLNYRPLVGYPSIGRSLYSAVGGAFVKQLLKNSGKFFRP